MKFIPFLIIIFAYIINLYAKEKNVKYADNYQFLYYIYFAVFSSCSFLLYYLAPTNNIKDETFALASLATVIILIIDIIYYCIKKYGFKLKLIQKFSIFIQRTYRSDNENFTFIVFLLCFIFMLWLVVDAPKHFPNEESKSYINTLISVFSICTSMMFTLWQNEKNSSHNYCDKLNDKIDSIIEDFNDLALLMLNVINSLDMLKQDIHVNNPYSEENPFVTVTKMQIAFDKIIAKIESATNNEKKFTHIKQQITKQFDEIKQEILNSLKLKEQDIQDNHKLLEKLFGITGKFITDSTKTVNELKRFK